MTEQIPDLSPLRSQFPGLQEVDERGNPFVFFDGPAGTQVPQAVINAVTDYYHRSNACKGGRFITSQRSTEVVEAARRAMADFLNAPSPQEIIFGPNMTTLTYNFSRSIGRLLQPGDEIVVTRLDHYANVSSWMALREHGIHVKQADFDVEDCRLDLDHLASLLTSKTKLVAVGYASNAVGTINPISRIAAMARNVGAWLFVDAVHYAPHGPIDVQALGCDFLVCSIYKFFGPHVAALWGKLNLLERIPAYQVEPGPAEPPGKFETGMPNFEGLAGATAAIDYLATLGREYGQQYAEGLSQYTGRRKELKQGMKAIMSYERQLFSHLMAELQTIPGLIIYGITEAEAFHERCPTVSFNIQGFTPAQVADHLCGQNIFVWDGNNYALGVTERLGIETSGGMVRVGVIHYNTREDVDRLIAALRTL